MSNVVAFKPRPKPAPVVELPSNKPPQAAQDFVLHYLYPWAQEQGIDTESTDFKFEMATIMTVAQGMLFRVK